jgi:hypothetical protein
MNDRAKGNDNKQVGIDRKNMLVISRLTKTLSIGLLGGYRIGRIIRS